MPKSIHAGRLPNLLKLIMLSKFSLCNTNTWFKIRLVMPFGKLEHSIEHSIWKTSMMSSSSNLRGSHHFRVRSWGRRLTTWSHCMCTLKMKHSIIFVPLKALSPYEIVNVHIVLNPWKLIRQSLKRSSPKSVSRFSIWRNSTMSWQLQAHKLNQSRVQRRTSNQIRITKINNACNR